MSEIGSGKTNWYRNELIEAKKTIKHQAEIIDKLKECVEFYADSRNWFWDKSTTPFNASVIMEDDLCKAMNGDYYGGKSARKTLEELEGRDG